MPDALDAFMVHLPARIVQQPGDHPITVAAILARQFDDVFGELCFIGPASGNLALGGTVLSKHATGPTFGNAKLIAHLANALAASRRA